MQEYHVEPGIQIYPSTLKAGYGCAIFSILWGIYTLQDHCQKSGTSIQRCRDAGRCHVARAVVLCLIVILKFSLPDEDSPWIGEKTYDVYFDGISMW